MPLGCAGWSYDDWKGVFYPAGCPPGDYLRRYARAFDAVEIDSTYYAWPKPEQVARWATETPERFRFSPKLPGALTHDRRLVDAIDESYRFLDLLAPLRKLGKLGPILVGLPPTFRRDRDLEAFEAFVSEFPSGVPFAVELRHASWWVPATYERLREKGATLVWSVTHQGTTPPEVTSDALYVRLIGDRALTEFGRIQRDLRDIIVDMRERIDASGIPRDHMWVFVNNHFMGFAPATAAIAADILGLQKPDLGAASREGNQRSLGEF